MYELNRFNLEKENLNRKKINSYNLEWMEQFKKNKTIKNIDRNIVDNFIENIFVNNDKSVVIKFRFKDEYEFALRYLQNQNNML